MGTVVSYIAFEEVKKELAHYKRKCEEYAKQLMKIADEKMENPSHEKNESWREEEH